MLPINTQRILDTLGDDALILDVGAWAAPFNRATHVIDALPYATRGVMGSYGPLEERFDESRWVVRDICDHEPWPWPDDHFDFALCVTTLEDVRDPVWVCQEMSRVAKSGYVEVPTVIAELIHGIDDGGDWVGHQHHRWLCFLDTEADSITFLHKNHAVHAQLAARVIPEWVGQMEMDDHLQGLFWSGRLDARERIGFGPPPLDELDALVAARFTPSTRYRVTRRLHRRVVDAARRRRRRKVKSRLAETWVRASAASGVSDHYNPPRAGGPAARKFSEPDPL